VRSRSAVGPGLGLGPGSVPVPVPVRAARRLRSGVGRVPPGTLEAAAIWLGSRAALVAFSLLATWVLGLDGNDRVGGRPLDGGTAWFLERFTWWDSFHFLRIADVGYLPPGLDCCDQAFLPGYPAVVAGLAPVLGGDLALAGFVVSVVASTVAAVLLWHLAETGVGPGAGRTAVLLLAVTPHAFFLTAVYSESLFLALALGAWLAGSHRRWWLAGLLAAGATTVRVNGLFLALGLVVLYAVQQHREGRRAVRRDAVALLAPAVAFAAYMGYLWWRTGSPDAWQEAQQRGWDRRVAAPWTGLAEGWTSLTAAQAPHIVVSRAADLVVAVVGVGLVVVLVRLRRWPEAAYVAPSVGVLVCSTTLISTPRYAVAWFPLYLLLAAAASHGRRPWLVPVLVVTGVPLLALVTLTFSAHLWTA